MTPGGIPPLAAAHGPAVIAPVLPYGFGSYKYDLFLPVTFPTMTTRRHPGRHGAGLRASGP